MIVTGSTINYDPANKGRRRSDLLTFSLKDGTELWSKEIPGGVLACAALTTSRSAWRPPAAVRAFDVENGERKWIYEAKMPLFAPVAIAKKNVSPATSRERSTRSTSRQAGVWTLDLGSNAETKSPGMVYGGPIVSGGRVVVATCNLEGPNARAETVVVGIGAK